MSGSSEMQHCGTHAQQRSFGRLHWHTQTRPDAWTCRYTGVHAHTPVHECSGCRWTGCRWSIIWTLFSSVEEEDAHVFRNTCVSTYIKHGSDWLKLDME